MQNMQKLMRNLTPKITLKPLFLFGIAAFFFVFNSFLLEGFEPEISFPLACPKPISGEEIIPHQAYWLSYNERHEQANWVAYMLTSSRLGVGVERSNRFLIDPLVEEGSATNADYAKSGFDRGHLAPAADMSWSIEVMKESFYYSNMSPQVPGFNRGIWKKLEEQVRLWAKQYDTLYIVTGPKLESGLPTIGPNQVSVPKLYYKALIAPNQQKGIAFLIPNEKSEEPLSHYLLSIDSLEQILHRDLFYQLADDRENVIEKQVKFWP
jgi:endonuclease G